MKVGIRPCLVVTMISLSIIRTLPRAWTRHCRAAGQRVQQRGILRADPGGLAWQEAISTTCCVPRSATGACLVSLRWRRTATASFYQGAFGRRGLNQPAAMTPDTVFRIASMTKAVTGVAAMQCVERGRLALDQPAGEIVPELAEPQVLEGFDADGKPRLRPARRKVTLRMLLTHTAGFVYPVWNANFNRYCEDDRLSHDHVRQARRAKCAARLRAGRALGIRHQHRLGRPHGRGGQRPGPRRLHAREHLRATRHARHRLRADAGAVRAQRAGACAQARRIAGTDRADAVRQVGVLRRRRRAVIHRPRLPDLPADAAGRRHVERCAASCSRRRSR